MSWTQGCSIYNHDGSLVGFLLLLLFFPLNLALPLGSILLYAKIRAYPKKGISPSAFSFSTKGSAVDGPSSGISDNERSSSPAWSQTVGSQVLAKRGHPPPPQKCSPKN